MDVAPGLDEALKNFVLPETLGFGAVNAPVMFSAQWRDQRNARAPVLLELRRCETLARPAERDAQDRRALNR